MKNPEVTEIIDVLTDLFIQAKELFVSGLPIEVAPAVGAMVLAIEEAHDRAMDLKFPDAEDDCDCYGCRMGMEREPDPAPDNGDN